MHQEFCGMAPWASSPWYNHNGWVACCLVVAMQRAMCAWSKWRTVAASRSTELVSMDLHNGRLCVALQFRNGKTSWFGLKLRNPLEYTSPCMLKSVWLLWWWDRPWKTNVRLLVKIYLHRQVPVKRRVERGSARWSSLKAWERPSSVRWTLDTFQRWCWGNLWEMGWSTYGLFRVQRYHLELNWTEHSCSQRSCSRPQQHSWHLWHGQRLLYLALMSAYRNTHTVTNRHPQRQ